MKTGTSVPSDTSATTALREKLSERVSEYLESHSIEQLADLLEIVYALGESHGVHPIELEQISNAKRDAQGSSRERIDTKQGLESVGGEQSLTIQELQRQVRELKRAQGWHDQTLERRAVFLMTEVGEMAKELLKVGRESSVTDGEQVRERLGMEIYDVVWNLCDLADLAGVDLERAFNAKSELNARRKW